MAYLEGPGELVSRSVTPITRIITVIIPIFKPFAKSP